MYCQKCRTPLKSENSLDTLNPAAFDILVGAVEKSRKPANVNLSFPRDRKDLYDQTVQQNQNALYKRNITAPHTDSHSRLSNVGMSFIDVTASQVVPTDAGRPQSRKSQDKKSTETTGENEKESLAWQLHRHERLFSILSSHSDIDHPVCAECSSILISQFNARLSSATRERDAYANFLKSLQQSSAHAEDVEATEKELQDLTEEQESTFTELLQLEKEKEMLETELADLEDARRQLDDEEQRYWEGRNSFDEKLYDIQAELSTLQEKFINDQKQLERLQRTNVYNDTFCIGHDGYFGTINGLRLGRLPNQNVEWAEINAAWGQTLLLLATVAERLNFTFQGYRLRPLGSTSRIERLEWPQQPPDAANVNRRTSQAVNQPQPKITPLDLFSSGDMPLGRVFNHRRFDAGMVAFLDCLSQLGSHVEKSSRSTPTANLTSPGRGNALILPYTIQADKIGDISIRLGVGFSQDENFTKACKYTLTCCKFLLAHVSNLESLKAI